MPNALTINYMTRIWTVEDRKKSKLLEMSKNSMKNRNKVKLTKLQFDRKEKLLEELDQQTRNND